MSKPHVKTVGGLAVEGGSSACFQIPFPPKAVIDRLIVKQTSGDYVDFEVFLLSRAGVCQQGESYSDEDGNDTPHELYKVSPTLDGEAGLLEHWPSDPWSFSNQDDLDEHTGGQPRFIYLHLSPEGTGDKTFSVTIGATESGWV